MPHDPPPALGVTLAEAESSGRKAFRHPAATAFGLALLAGLLLASAWLWLDRRQEGVRQSWIRQERAEMGQILYKVARFSEPETLMAFLMRRVGTSLRNGKTAAEAIVPLHPYLGSGLEILLFDADGRRLTPEGFSREKVAVSERVLKTLLASRVFTAANARSISASFFGTRTALERVSQAPGVLVRLKGAPVYEFAGWWPVEIALGGPGSEAGDRGRGMGPGSPGGPGGRGGSGASGTRVLGSRGAGVAQILLLARRGALPARTLANRAITSVRRSLGSRYRLGILPAGLMRPTHTPIHGDGSPRTAGRWLTQTLDLWGRHRLIMACPDEPEGSARLAGSVLELLRIGLAALLFLAGLIGVRWVYQASPPQVSLRSLIIGGIGVAVVPVLVVTTGWATEYLATSTETLAWETHRDLERRLEEIDRGLDRLQRGVETRLRGFADGLGAASGPVQAPLTVTGLPGQGLVEAAYLLSGDGKVLRTFRERADLSRELRDLAAGFAINLMATVVNREPGSVGRTTFDLRFIVGLSRHLLGNLGRIVVFEGLGYRRSLFLRAFGNPLVPGETRFFIAFLNMQDLQRAYLRGVARQPGIGAAFGLVEMGAAGPLWSKPERLLWQADLLTLCERVGRTRQPGDARVSLPGRGVYLATAFPTRFLGNYLLVGGLPLEVIEARQRGLLLLLGLGILGVLGITGASSWFLADRLLVGVRRISGGLRAIEGGTFVLTPIPVRDQLDRIYGGVAKAAETMAQIYEALPVQKTLIAQGDWRGEGWAVSSSYVPGESLGGDFTDFFPLAGGGLLLCVGEASGGSVPASLLLAQVKMGVAMWGKLSSDPAVILSRLNEIVRKVKLRTRHISLFLAIARPDGRLVFGNAGHSWPLWLARTPPQGEHPAGVTGIQPSATASGADHAPAPPLPDAGQDTSGPRGDLPADERTALPRQGVPEAGSPGSRWLETRGWPLGSRLMREFPVQEIAFSDGEGLLLYTRGWIRALDPLSTGSGFDRFRETIDAAPAAGVSAWREALERVIPTTGARHLREGDRVLVLLQRETGA